MKVNTTFLPKFTVFVWHLMRSLDHQRTETTLRLLLESLSRRSSPAHNRYILQLKRAIYMYIHVLVHYCISSVFQDPSKFCHAFDDLTDYLESEKGWKIAVDELTGRKVTPYPLPLPNVCTCIHTDIHTHIHVHTRTHTAGARTCIVVVP